MPPTADTVRRGIGLLAIGAVAYTVSALASGGPILPPITIPTSPLPGLSMPTVSMPALGGTTKTLIALTGLAAIYAIATKRGWQGDIRYLIQVAALALIAYLIGTQLGPTLLELLP